MVRKPDRQISFTGGLMSREFWERVDHVKRATGLAVSRNQQNKRSGAIQNRPGTIFIGEAGERGVKHRLIEFEFNSEQTYGLYFGDETMRVIHDDAFVVDVVVSVQAITSAAEGVVTYIGSDVLANGDEILFAGVLGDMGDLVNGRTFKVSDINTTLNTFKLKLMDGVTFLDTSGVAATGTAGTMARIYEISTPYAAADIFDLQFVQEADVMLITHGLYPTQKLSRTGHAAWAFAEAEFDWKPGGRSRGGFTSITAGGTGAGNEYRYRVCAVLESGEELQPIPSIQGAITSVGTAAGEPTFPILVVTTAAHGLTTGDIVLIHSVENLPSPPPGTIDIKDAGVNFRRFSVTVLSSDRFTLDGANRDNLSFTGGTFLREYFVIRNANPPGVGAAAHTIVFTSPANSAVKRFNIYRADKDGVFGRIAEVWTEFGKGNSYTFRDTGTPTPNYTLTNPMAEYPFYDKDGKGYPSVCFRADQRYGLAALPEDPEAGYLSKPTQSTAFAPSLQLEDNSPIHFKAANRRVSQIRYAVEVGDSVIFFTTSGEMVMRGNANGVLTPSQISVRWSTSNVRSAAYDTTHKEVTLVPLVVGNSILFLDATLGTIYAFIFNFEVDDFQAEDITLFIPHLTLGRRVVSWCYQQDPNSIVWAALDNGEMLGLTLVRQHAIFAWHQHDTRGEFESVICLRQGNKDVVFASVKRVIQGADVRYVEKFADRELADLDIDDAIFTDSTISYDGTNTSAVVTVTVSGGTEWNDEEQLALIANSGIFSADDVDNVIVITNPDTEEEIRFRITDFTLPSAVTGFVNKIVPASMRDVAFSTWGRAVNRVSGGWHLEGEDVAILADKQVVADPNDPEFDVVTMAGGETDLPGGPYVKIRLGLPFVSDGQILPIDSGSPPGANERNTIQGVVVYFVKTRGTFWTALDLPATDAIDRETFSEIDARTDEPPGIAPEYVDGPVTIPLTGKPEAEAQVAWRQTAPLPYTIASITPQGSVR